MCGVVQCMYMLLQNLLLKAILAILNVIISVGIHRAYYSIALIQCNVVNVINLCDILFRPLHLHGQLQTESRGCAPNPDTLLPCQPRSLLHQVLVLHVRIPQHGTSESMSLSYLPGSILEKMLICYKGCTKYTCI